MATKLFEPTKATAPVYARELWRSFMRKSHGEGSYVGLVKEGIYHVPDKGIYVLARDFDLGLEKNVRLAKADHALSLRGKYDTRAVQLTEQQFAQNSVLNGEFAPKHHWLFLWLFGDKMETARETYDIKASGLVPGIQSRFEVDLIGEEVAGPINGPYWEYGVMVRPASPEGILRTQFILDDKGRWGSK